MHAGVVSEWGSHEMFHADFPALPREGDSIQVIDSDGDWRDATVLRVAFERAEKTVPGAPQPYSVLVVTE